MDDRQLTIIVVPHGDLETRTFAFSYRTLRIAGISLGVAVILVAIVVASWFPVALLAARVPALKRELAQLESERAKVNELARDLRNVEAQYQKVREMLGSDAPAAGSPPTLPPLRGDSGGSNDPDPQPLSQADIVNVWPLGVRGFVTQTVGAGRQRHPGIDIAVALKSEVRAAGSGRILRVAEDEVYGKYIVISHGGGYQTVYGHLSRAVVREGDSVTAGQRIGESGTSGKSSGEHLHFEVRHNNEFLDPLRFIRQPG